MPLAFVKAEHKLLWNKCVCTCSCSCLCSCCLRACQSLLTAVLLSLLSGSLIAQLGEEKGIFVSGVGVTFGPSGSTWARNPVPRVNTVHSTRISLQCCGILKSSPLFTLLLLVRTTAGSRMRRAATAPTVAGRTTAAETTRSASSSRRSARRTRARIRCAPRPKAGRAHTMALVRYTRITSNLFRCVWIPQVSPCC